MAKQPYYLQVIFLSDRDDICQAYSLSIIKSKVFLTGHNFIIHKAYYSKTLEFTLKYCELIIHSKILWAIKIINYYGAYYKRYDQVRYSVTNSLSWQKVITCMRCVFPFREENKLFRTAAAFTNLTFWNSFALVVTAQTWFLSIDKIVPLKQSCDGNLWKWRF